MTRDRIFFILAAAAAFVVGLGCGLFIGPDMPVAPAQAVQSTATAQERSVAVTPSRTTFKGEGETVTKEVKAWRIFSPFGMSPAEMISHIKDLEDKGGNAPAVNIGPGGVQTSESSRGSFSDAGLSWTLWDSIKAFLRKAMWFGILGGAGLLALYLIPATKPIASMILRGLAAIVPIIGSIVERIVSWFKWQKPLEQTVAGVQNVKAGMTEEAKTAVNAKLMAAQDEGTQATVKTIKAGL